MKIAAHHVNSRGGVLIGDVVGLGKTLMATALARILEDDLGLESVEAPAGIFGVRERLLVFALCRAAGKAVRHRGPTAFNVHYREQDGGRTDALYGLFEMALRVTRTPNVDHPVRRVSQRAEHFLAPEIGKNAEAEILAKVQQADQTIGDFTLTGRAAMESKSLVYYRTTGGRYWKVFTDFAPGFSRDGV